MVAGTKTRAVGIRGDRRSDRDADGRSQCSSPSQRQRWLAIFSCSLIQSRQTHPFEEWSTGEGDWPAVVIGVGVVILVNLRLFASPPLGPLMLPTLSLFALPSFFIGVAEERG